MDFSRMQFTEIYKKGDRDGDKSNGGRWPVLGFGESLKIILSAHPDIEVVATVEDGNHVLSSIPQHIPDPILMDIRMPGMDGSLATKEVKEHYPDIKIIILTTLMMMNLSIVHSSMVLQVIFKREPRQRNSMKLLGWCIKAEPWSTRNIASKSFKFFSQMAKTNFSIAVDEDNVKDLSTTEWRIIQEVGYGESNKEIAAKLFLSEGTVRNYLSTILAKLNLRDRTQLAIWSVQTGVTRRDFQKEIRNEIEGKHLCLGLGLLVMLCVSAGFYWWKQQPTVLHIGVLSGSSWDVPTSQRSHALDRAIQKFEKSHPHVRVEYENGIP